LGNPEEQAKYARYVKYTLGNQTKKEERAKETNVLKKTNALMGPQAWYGLAQGLPGAKKSAIAQRNAYRNYYIDTFGYDPFGGKLDESYETWQMLKGFKPDVRDEGDPMTYAEFLATQGNFNLLAGGNLGNLKDLPLPENLTDPKTGKLITEAEWDQIKRASGQGASSYEDNGVHAGQLFTTTNNTNTTNTTTDNDIPTGPVDFPYTIDPDPDDFTQGRGGLFYNDGGRAGYVLVNYLKKLQNLLRKLQKAN
jgi:hypothetical protein